MQLTSPLSQRRGDIDVTASMEKLQDAHLLALAATIGCTLSKPDPDPGIDWTITHTSSRHSTYTSAQIDVGLKSTQQTKPKATGEFSFSLRNSHLAKLSSTRLMAPRLLIVMLTPTDPGDWLEVGDFWTTVSHSMYWVNLRGTPATGVSETNVRVPYSQRLTAETLCDLLDRVGGGDML